MFLNPIDHRVAFLARQPLREKLHDPRVSVHPCKRFAVARLPIS
jgi:hypothetical protein